MLTAIITKIFRKGVKVGDEKENRNMKVRHMTETFYFEHV